MRAWSTTVHLGSKLAFACIPVVALPGLARQPIASASTEQPGSLRRGVHPYRRRERQRLRSRLRGLHRSCARPLDREPRRALEGSALARQGRHG